MKRWYRVSFWENNQIDWVRIPDTTHDSNLHWFANGFEGHQLLISTEDLMIGAFKSGKPSLWIEVRKEE